MGTTMRMRTRKRPRRPSRQRKMNWQEPSRLPLYFGILAAALLSVLVFYLTMVAPSEVPVPRGVKVPFPAATRVLEKAVRWCGHNPVFVLLIGAGLLVPGLVLRLRSQRYYLWLSVVAALALGFTYLSISAPIDRLLRTVEENVPDRPPPTRYIEK